MGDLCFQIGSPVLDVNRLVYAFIFPLRAKFDDPIEMFFPEGGKKQQQPWGRKLKSQNPVKFPLKVFICES